MQYIGGNEPHQLDITSFLTPGKSAMLTITVGDRGIAAVKPFDPFNNQNSGKDNLTFPLNIWHSLGRELNEVTIEAVPGVRTDYVFANPKVSRGMLQYTVMLVNDTPVEWRGHVRSDAVGAKVLLNEDVRIPARGSQKIYREIPWADAILWDLDNPHLYDLRTTLSAHGRVVDVQRDYFGFREFAIRGADYYLNGKKIHLLGNSGHVQQAQNDMTLAQKIRFLRDAKEIGHLNHVRLHAAPQDKRWVLATDRVGMLLTTETALWTMDYESLDWGGSEEATYQNVRTHWFNALVHRDRNNPSVVIWSLSNEMSPITQSDLEEWGAKIQGLTRSFKKIIAETKAEDDSRVIQMSSAVDFLGNLDNYNLHYPGGFLEHPDYPYPARWLDTGRQFEWYGAAEKYPIWSWQRDKPLIVDEFLDIEPSTDPAEAGLSTLIGDAAFEGNGTMLTAAKLWPMETIAYRRQGVSGFCAWSFLLWGTTDFKEIIKRPDAAAYCQAIRPVAVLDHGYRTRYFARDDVAVELSLHNDTRQAMSLSLKCEASKDGNVVWSATRPSATFAAAELATFTTHLLAPASEKDYALDFHAVLGSGTRWWTSGIRH